MIPINEQEAYIVLWAALAELGWEATLVHATYMDYSRRKMRPAFLAKLAFG